MSVSGAPVCEGRWIPDAGDIIATRSVQETACAAIQTDIRGGSMSKLRMLLFVVVGILMSAMTVFAQGEGGADNASSVNKYRALAAGIGFAIAVFGGAIGQSRIGASACEGAARNPGAAGRIQ